MKTYGGKGSETSSREEVAHVVVRRDVDGDQYMSVAWTGKPPSNGTKLYTTPQAECAPRALTDERIDVIANDHFIGYNNLTRHQWQTFARAVEQAVKQKGG